MLFHQSTWCSLGNPSKLSFSCPQSSLFFYSLPSTKTLAAIFFLTDQKMIFFCCYLTLNLAAFTPRAHKEIPLSREKAILIIWEMREVAQSKIGQDHGRDNMALQDRAFYSRFRGHHFSVREKGWPGEEWPGAAVALEGFNSELPPDVIQSIPYPLSVKAWVTETGYDQCPPVPSHVWAPTRPRT